jgi:hypothetical protein
LPTHPESSPLSKGTAQEYNDAHGWLSPLVPDSDRTKFNHRSELTEWAVYRARDTRLDRSVAIKILPEAFLSDADRLQLSAGSTHP